MEIVNGRHAWMVKIGEKGQFVIPKEARDKFDLQPGQTILVLADDARGLAILPRKESERLMSQIFGQVEFGGF